MSSVAHLVLAPFQPRFPLSPRTVSPFCCSRLNHNDNNLGACSIHQTPSTTIIESRRPNLQIHMAALSHSHVAIARSLAMTRDGSSSHPPAQVVGGQRRRLARRANVPRSNTMPVLNPQSGTASHVCSTVNPNITAGEEGANMASSSIATSLLEMSQSMSNFCELLPSP